MTKINPEIFRTYDVRGIYPDEINSEFAYCAARAHIRFLKAKKIAIGWDMRLGSKKLAEAAIRGAVDEGADIYNLGRVGIELLYYTCGKYKMDGGIAITASHNPKEYAGMKFIRENATSLTMVTGLEKIKNLTLIQPWLKEKQIKKKGQIIRKNVWHEYANFIKSIVNPRKFREMKIVIDAQNGMAGLAMEKILQNSKINYIKLNFEPDGNFPKHDPNPLLPENRVEMVDAVKQEKAEAGISFDGDGDRVVLIDEKGEVITTDFVGALIAECLLKKYQGAAFVWDLRRGWAIRDLVEQNKAKFIVTKAGYPFIKQGMKKYKAVFGGETSGHYFYKSFFNSDSGTLTALYILELLSEEKKSLSQLVKKYRDNYFMVEEMNFETENAEKIFVVIEKFYKERKIKTSRLDGVSIETKDWHCNLRASNTEPLIRFNIEAKTKELLRQKTDEVVGLIKKNI
ncbi:MAG: phosphomannomutase [Candidatus Berkelbacteria bacterium Licking1014_96]|uniref:Phosphomannomutase n=1 Tax=Candidatus Berkelbacteria bacterium Licking1014_96 TaxID=2017149 RepID=A0A554LFT1_9BACT|nr:MAG: phosphomannomutase [Candidatus Berkelbacteria bacterium Licking1014_96]